MIEALRGARDQLFRLATIGRDYAEVDGIKLSLREASPRMRYVMFRGYEAGDADLAIRHLGATDRVLELGSSIGFVAMRCLQRWPQLDYCLVEANPYLPAIIKRNFDLNGISVRPILNVAAGDVDGVASFGVSRNSWSSSILPRAGEVERVDVPVRTLSSIKSDLPFTPNFLICDIEGGETSLRFDELASFDKILIEFHPKLTGEDAVAAITKGLAERGLREKDRDRATVFFEREMR